MLTPLRLELLDLEGRLSVLNGCDSGELSNLKVKRFDRVKDVTFVHKLVVDNSHIGDFARYLRCDARDLYTHGPIPRPGGRYIVLPSEKSGQDGEQRDRKRSKTLTNRDQEQWNGTVLLSRHR